MTDEESEEDLRKAVREMEVDEINLVVDGEDDESNSIPSTNLNIDVDPTDVIDTEAIKEVISTTSKQMERKMKKESPITVNDVTVDGMDIRNILNEAEKFCKGFLSDFNIKAEALLYDDPEALIAGRLKVYITKWNEIPGTKIRDCEDKLAERPFIPQGVEVTLSSYNNMVHRPSIGQRVVALNSNGAVSEGEAIEYPSGVADTYTIEDIGETLYEYWSNKGFSVDRDEEIITIEHYGGGRYTYPITRVVPYDDSPLSVDGVSPDTCAKLMASGFNTKSDVAHTSKSQIQKIGLTNMLVERMKKQISVPQESTEEERMKGDLTRIYECPECGDSFPEGSSGIVEGDKGEIFCSLDCLHNHYD